MTNGFPKNAEGLLLNRAMSLPSAIAKKTGQAVIHISER
jgi:hypothetical protein